MMRRGLGRLALTLACAALAPTAAFAQSAIAGAVKDATGAVLPGVTVEAASDVLIEKVRTVTTDEAGLYRIVDLRPGIYKVTFTLPGFNTVVREGIELPTNFTSTINADMRVGAIEETVTVTGASPIVDVKSATQQQVLPRDLLDAIPTGRNIWAIGGTLSGVTLSAPDVGGTAGMQQTYMAVHGSRRSDNAIQVDGMSVNGIEGDGAIQNYFNEGMFQEMAYQTSALTAEVQASGVRLNMIPKEGGNAFKGSVFISRTPGAWQSDNFTNELKQRGLQAPNRVEKIHDFNPGFGGPVSKNRLWFFTSFRRWGVDQTVTDSFYNLDPTHKTYIPANGLQGRSLQPTVDDNIIKSGVVRLTWQMSPKQKFSAYLDRIVKFRGHECPAFYAEEACGIRSPKRYFTAQAKYTATVSSRLLVEAGWSENDETYSTNEAQPSVRPNDIPRFDRTTSEAWGAPQGPYYFRVPDRWTYTGAVSYVTGTHAFKAGAQLGQGGNRHQRSLQNGIDLIQEYRLTATTGVRAPVSVQTYNTTQWSQENIKYDLGIYVQDSWTRDRLTLNPGLRMEFFNTYIPKEVSPAGRFVPGREYGPIFGLPNWKDPFVPRLGGVYDLRGDGKTAIKGHIGKYMQAFSTVGFAQVYNPLRQETDRRTWSDPNGDDIAQNSEIGPINTPFNTGASLNRIPDPGIDRPYQWEYSLGLQREVMHGVSVSGNWVRRSYRRIFWTDNIDTTFEDYTIVNTPNPLNPSESLPIYNLSRTKLGLVHQVDKNSDKNQKWYNGYDLGFTARVGNGGTVYGGVSTGRQITVNCEVDDPNSLRFCDQTTLDIPYLTQFKISGSYPLPYGIQISGNWQGYPGVASGTNRQDGDYTAANNRVIDPSLNVNYVVDRTIVPSLVVSSVTVPLLKPGTKYLDRWNQVDVRLAKKFQVQKVRFQGQLDIFNILNASSILSTNETYGSSLDRPSSILQGRLIAIGAQMTF